jgi:Acyl-CoA dehydrogenase, C-terminal domain
MLKSLRLPTMKPTLPDNQTGGPACAAGVICDRAGVENSGSAASAASTAVAEEAQAGLLKEYQAIERIALSNPADAVLQADRCLKTRILSFLAESKPWLQEILSPVSMDLAWISTQETVATATGKEKRARISGEDPLTLVQPGSPAVMSVLRQSPDLPAILISDWLPEFYSEPVVTAAFPGLRFFRLNIRANAPLRGGMLHICGEEARAAIQQAISERCLLLSAVVLGASREIFNYVLEYSQKRITFGKAICHHQAVALKLAEIATSLYSAGLIGREACAVERGAQEFCHHAQNAWYYTEEAALKSAITAAQIMGGHGFLQFHPVQQWLCEIQFLRQYGALTQEFEEP